ncbi:hypothetical protein [Mahella australiensis]|jgi:hypothetical protein|uniref:Uncharacterized protein n=1 Tax=Mahella australiensis (strain DSM 15567 / CIP 107919 / 50-1 BON) TaxID=697281 RepID=F3ZXV8_MAHA5|nr:hypothetical protein [Mahella australiensis]AEE96628.1 hypothetical protein Mahau_1435 [Mahella australiensis 50-1 BON]
MKFKNLFATDVRRALLSWRFLLSSSGVSCIMLGAVSGLLRKSDFSSIWYFMYLSMGGSGTASIILSIIPVFTFAISFAIEWEEKAVYFWIVRAGIIRYTISKIVVSAISGFLTVVVGMILFIVILMPWFPLFAISSTDYSYEILMGQGYVLLGMLLYIAHFGFTGALMAVCAMWISVYIPNRFVAAASPVVLQFTLTRFTSGRELPGYLNPILWFDGIYDVGSPFATLLIKLTTVLVLCSLMGIAATVQMKRRVSRA